MNLNESDVAEVKALIAAIQEDWRDETPKLVLADWLTEFAPEETDLIDLLRGGARKWIKDFVEPYNQPELGRSLDADDLIRQAIDVVTGFDGGSGIDFDDDEDLADRFRRGKEEVVQFWRMISVISGYPIDAPYPMVRRDLYPDDEEYDDPCCGQGPWCGC